MNSRYQIVRQLADGRFHSGEALASRLGITRAAVWKQLKTLQAHLNIEIQAVSGRGYRLARPLELLDLNAISRDISSEAKARIAQVEIHDHIDSTNAYLMRRGAEGAPGGQVCLAEQQSAGRGRRGRSWVSPYGSNIYLSILWRYNLAPAQLSGLSLAAGIAVAQVLEMLGLKGVGLKWPNDILWRERKLAGMLLEVAGESEGPSRVVLGLGLNTCLPGESAGAIDQPWIDLASIPGGRDISRNRLAGALIETLTAMLQRFEAQGLTALPEMWRRYDCHYGKRVLLSMGDRAIEGIHQGIDAQGALRLTVDGQEQRFHAGEVSLRVST